MAEWQKPRTKPWLRFVAFLTVILFTATNVFGADTVQAFHPNPSPNLASPSISDSDSRNILDTIAIPDSIGQIKKTFQGSRDKIIVHIQDAHVNEDAQRNIANILDYFADQHSLRLVNLEGGEGHLRTDVFSGFKQFASKKDVADHFLKEGRLSGPQYLAVTSRPDLSLFGVEDAKLYEDNRNAYLEALSFKQRDEELLAKIDKALQDVSRFVFSEDLRELSKKRAAFQDGGKELLSYVQFLTESAKKHNVGLHDYQGIHSLLNLIELEKEIDIEKAEQEIEQLTVDLKKIISRDRLSRFLTNTVQFRMKKMKRSAYYGYLEQEILTVDQRKKNALSLKDRYSNVLKYLKYTQLFDAIDLEIFSEIENLEKGIKTKLFRSDDEVQLDRVMRIYEIMRKIFEFTLTKQDADFFYTFREDFKVSTFSGFLEPMFKKFHFSYALPKNLGVLDGDLARIEKFYAAAMARDQVLIQKAIDRMAADGENISAIVTGGFHTPGIEKYLREHDYSYVVITPAISKAFDVKKENKIYEQALRGTPLQLEKILAQAYFPANSEKLNDSRFQLMPAQLIPGKLDFLTTPEDPGNQSAGTFFMLTLYLEIALGNIPVISGIERYIADLDIPVGDRPIVLKGLEILGSAVSGADTAKRYPNVVFSPRASGKINVLMASPKEQAARLAMSEIRSAAGKMLQEEVGEITVYTVDVNRYQMPSNVAAALQKSAETAKSEIRAIAEKQLIKELAVNFSNLTFASDDLGSAEDQARDQDQFQNWILSNSEVQKRLKSAREKAGAADNSIYVRAFRERDSGGEVISTRYKLIIAGDKSRQSIIIQFSTDPAGTIAA